VNLVFEILGKAGMRINGLKCIFHVKEMKFLGYIVGLNGIKIDLKKKYRQFRTGPYHEM
jgi:hypothetical protein